VHAIRMTPSTRRLHLAIKKQGEGLFKRGGGGAACLGTSAGEGRTLKRSKIRKRVTSKGGGGGGWGGGGVGGGGGLKAMV